MKRIYPFIIILSAVAIVFAQSARVKSNIESPKQSATTVPITPEKMYLEANDYARVKFAEFNQKKIPFNETLRVNTLTEQQKLAAKYATILGSDQNLAKQDLFYLGMLHWLAGNNEGADQALKDYLTFDNSQSEKKQTARRILTITSARLNQFPEAETFLLDYRHGESLNAKDLGEMENEIAGAYFGKKNYELAAKHAEEAYRIAKESFQPTARARGLAEILDRGKTLFEIYRASNITANADKTLEDLRKTAILLTSNGIYFYAVDNEIRYLIATNRKNLGTEIADHLKDQVPKDFTDAALSEELKTRFSRRLRQYRLMGEPAPEFVDINSWIPGETRKLQSLHGKIVILDFWATWCGPCIESFPFLRDIYNSSSRDDLEILGVTRFYGISETAEVTEATELEMLKHFRAKWKLPYDFVIAENRDNEINYAAIALPTIVIIDRKGVVRYIETGMVESRGDEIKSEVERLLAEK